MPPSATGNASRHKPSAWARPRWAASSGFGFSRGRKGVVPGIPMTSASSGSSRVARRSSIARRRASACATDGGPASTADKVRVPRSERSTRRRTASGAAPNASRSGERAIRSAASSSYGYPRSSPVNCGWLSTSETPKSGTRVASVRSTSVASRQPSEPPVSSSDSAVARRCVSASAAASSVAGPPCRTVSAALTTTTRSVSTSSRATRTRGASAGIPASPGSAASCTATLPWKRRRNSGVTSAAISERLARRPSPPATSRVWLLVGTPSSSSASLTAATAGRRGSAATPPIGRAVGSATMVTRVAGVTSVSSEGPSSGNRRASRVAASTSVARPGGGGRRMRASAGADATTRRVPQRSGTRGTTESRGEAARRSCESRASARSATRAGSSRASR